jgi:para-nitrobenzyl esterase
MNRRSFIGTGTLAAAGALINVNRLSAAQAPRPASASGGPVVETTAGRVRGYVQDRVYGFRGIPYGASTAGANRFLPPQKPQAWTGVRDALDIGFRAPQDQDARVPEWFVMDRTEPQGEDCLVLNVWTNGLNDGQKRPVMVWLHGGGFTGGSGGFTVYDGANLARTHNVVVVGTNHRLNGFGYLWLGDIGGEKYANGNVGMLDIIASLEWVRDNIERFGGDPNAVTVFGQSGGGSKVSTLLGMPAAKGLFHRAIAMSGSQVRSNTREQATRSAQALLTRLNVAPNQLERLHQIPMRQIREIVNAGGNGIGGWGPVVDGRTLPAHIFDPVASAISADVPLMIGSTETEQTWNEGQFYDPLSDAELREDVMRALRTDAAGADRVIGVYKKNRPRASNLDIYLILVSDASNFRTGTDTQAERKAALGRASVYKYYFQWYSPVRGGMLRSMHTMDVPFVFENHRIAHTELGTGPELQPLADKMAGAWAAFARTGSPNHRLIPNWPAYSSSTRATMVFNNDTKVVNDPYGEEKAAIAAARGPAQGRGGGPPATGGE